MGSGPAGETVTTQPHGRDEGAPAPENAADAGRGLDANGDPLGLPEGFLGRATRELSEGHTAVTLLSALLVWAITLAPAALSRGAPLHAKALCLLSLAAGLSGPVLLSSKPRLARHLGITAFLSLATLTWLASGLAIHPSRLDWIRAVFGSIAWGVYALSWSERWSKRREIVQIDPEAAALQARSTLPALAVPVTTVGTFAAVAMLVLAWRIGDPERALVGHAVAVACAVGLVTASATVATARGKRRSSSGRRLTGTAIRAIGLLVVCAVTGAVLFALR
jgi:hypothetical protein